MIFIIFPRQCTVGVTGLTFSAKVLVMYFGEDQGEDCNCVLAYIYFVAYIVLLFEHFEQ